MDVIKEEIKEWNKLGYKEPWKSHPEDFEKSIKKAIADKINAHKKWCQDRGFLTSRITEILEILGLEEK